MRLANQNEAKVCYQCIEDARAYHKSLGFEQWHPDYPTQQTILDGSSNQAGCRDVFHINLNFLPRIVCCLLFLGMYFGFGSLTAI